MVGGGEGGGGGGVISPFITWEVVIQVMLQRVYTSIICCFFIFLYIL